jgi:hypothetical protein
MLLEFAFMYHNNFLFTCAWSYDQSIRFIMEVEVYG